MISILGIVIVFGAIAAGYLMEHGKFAVLFQPAELIIILGAAIGTVVISNPLPTLIRIGKGIAVPHARSTMVTERAVLLARSSKGVEFDAADEGLVHLIFMIVAPPTERDPIYLQMLAQIVRAVRLAPARRRILEAPDFAAIRSSG